MRKNAPRDPRQFVGQRNRQHVAVQPLFGSLNPELEPVALPAIWLDQHHPGRLHEQNPQVTIAPLRYLAKDGAGPGRDLPGHEAEPSGEVAAPGEYVTCTDRRHDRTGDDGADAGHADQPVAARVLVRDDFDLVR